MTVISTLETILTADDSGLRAGLKGAEGLLDATVGRMGAGVKWLGGQLTGVGTALTTAMAPLAAGLGLAVKGALDFDAAMANISAVTGQTGAEMTQLREQILAIGATSRAGPEAAAQAFYDIAGGVLDASSRLDILRTSIATAEAGAASLTGTTSALISVMNAFGATGLKAATAGDILTVAVNKGVGTMDELAAAIPGAAAIAANAGVSFQELATAMAFSTTSGFSFSEAATQMQSIMRAFLNPNKQMTEALAKMGYTSGSAALKALGLTGAVRALSKATGGSLDVLTQATGRFEASQGAMALLKDGFDGFSQSFADMTNGATDTAQAIQNLSGQAGLDHLKSQLQALGITLGDTLLPRISELVDRVTPVILSITDWVNANPALTGTILEVVAALAVLGPVLIIVGQALTAIGTIITLVSSGPFLVLIAAFAALKLAYDNNFLGFKDWVDKIVTQLPALGARIQAELSLIAFYFDYYFGPTLAAAKTAIDQLGVIIPYALNLASTAAQQLGLIAINALNSVATTAGQLVFIVVAALATASTAAAQLVGIVKAYVTIVYNWIVNNIVLPLQRVFDSLPESLRKSMTTMVSDIARFILQNQGFFSLLPNGGAFINVANQIVAGGTRDSGGEGMAGHAYVINPKAGPEVFVPRSSGTFYPNADRLMGGGGVQIGTLVLGDTGHMTPEEVMSYAEQGLKRALQHIAGKRR